MHKVRTAWPVTTRVPRTRRLAGLLAGLTQATLLMEEAVEGLAKVGSARKAVVVQLVAGEHLAER